MGVNTEAETVVKRILPYLRRRGYVVESDLDFETAVKTPDRYARGYIDILVTCGKAKPYFLIEAKRSSKRLGVKDRDQAISYGCGQKVPFVVVTNGTEVQCFNTASKEPIRWNGKTIERIPTKDQMVAVSAAFKTNKNLTDVPLGNDTSLPFRPGLPLKQLDALFARCHNAIRKIEKDENHVFADFSKLLFLKLLEEKADEGDVTLPYSYRLHELAEKPSAEADQVQAAVLSMIENIRKNTPYGDVLEDPISLKKPATFRYIVSQLASVSFRDSSLDSKGAAFEYFVRATLKGKNLGQYFTPRPLVDLMLSMVGRDKIINSVLSGDDVRVLDPACGTGGFLVFAMRDAVDTLARRLAAKSITKSAHDKARLKVMQSVFFGADANPGVACAAKMNMIVAGDGHTNIRAEDSLSLAAKTWAVNRPEADIILTNPPFGTSESDSLSAADRAQYPIATARGQLLFLQKMVLGTSPGGDICTVIDEGVLNTDSSSAIRRWLLQECELVTVVRLPEETFKPNKITVRASVLHLRRREAVDADLELSYKVTMCDLESLGYHGSGETIRGFDFDRLRKEFGEHALAPSRTKRSGYNWEAFEVQAQDIVAAPGLRLDYKYWEPGVRTRIDALVTSGRGLAIAKLNTIPTARGKSPPADRYVDEPDGYALVIKAGSNISRYGEVLFDGDFIEKNLFDEGGWCDVQKGDVVLASTGDGTLGKCAVYQDARPAIADGHVTVIRVDAEKVDADYLAAYLRVGFGHVQVERLFSGSTGLIELTPAHVDSVVIDLLDGLPAQVAATKRLLSAESTFRQAAEAAAADLSKARDEFLTL
ncbi:N-6 DNA methylase [Myxococcota bacterium]|nr:N-6 DNA methylase [Myxococcota bacterium]